MLNNVHFNVQFYICQEKIPKIEGKMIYFTWGFCAYLLCPDINRSKMGQIIEVLLFDGWGILRKEKVRVGTIVDFKSSCNDFDVEF